jgi:hypothetical protein
MSIRDRDAAIKMIGNPSDYLTLHGPDSIILRAQNREPFDLLAFDFGPSTESVNGIGRIKIEGHRNGELTPTLTTTLSGITTAAAIELNWSNLTMVKFRSVDYPMVGLDNVHAIQLNPAGDFDGDDDVDANDFAQWLGDFGLNGDSDADDDGDSDGADLLRWQRNLGMNVSTSATASVPEPSAFAISASSLFALGFIRRRQIR